MTIWNLLPLQSPICFLKDLRRDGICASSWRNDIDVDEKEVDDDDDGSNSSVLRLSRLMPAEFGNSDSSAAAWKQVVSATKTERIRCICAAAKVRMAMLGKKEKRRVCLLSRSDGCR